MSYVFLKTCLAVVGCVVLFCTNVLSQVNIALNRPATQSSNYSATGFVAVAGLAVDGNNNTNFYAESCAHTRSDVRAWWGVDLGHIYNLKSVAITRRGDKSFIAPRLGNFTIEVSRERKTNGDLINPCLCHFEPGNPPIGERTNFTCDEGAEGRYVRIQLQGLNHEYLTLCEVEVFGTRSILSQVNIALNRTATQSSNYSATGFVAVAGLAVDGNNNTNFYAKSCAHTRSDVRAWWGVDLGHIYNLKSVVITRRGDKSFIAPRLGNFTIEVSEERETNGSLINPRLCYFEPGNPPIGKSTSFTCDPGAVGRYVRIQLQGPNHEYLTLCEVEVFGKRLCK